ncbi:calpain-9 isoform X2 [Melanotaenia boesemani]|uniref:calpain-9 isoform X2 n=1 Tax=Melanotaenia boesemani TaxID=1250792 RepID=UPI001C05C732|nr:calpain-9 isoform X2 [Melanotaenia boesemani]
MPGGKTSLLEGVHHQGPDRLVPASDTEENSPHSFVSLSPRFGLKQKKMPLQSTLSGRSADSIKAENTQMNGKSFEQLRDECLQKGVLFEDPDFPATDSSLFFSQSIPVDIKWKRPREICQNPKFIEGGADRTDICQGQLGDCWLLAAIASLTLKENALARVVPKNQEFDHKYAGIFHFQFWQHNKWLDVVVDDRLPAVRNQLIMLHSATNNEFWSALLEKAYAKMHGSYESLKGGSTMEAMEDFTGGVGEVYETKNGPNDLFSIMKKALDRGSMMGCSIDTTSSAESEARTSTGLVKGHAYSITGLEEVNFRGQTIKLIRIRNPWGQVEWNGPWSDNSREWDYIDKSEKNRILQISDDGEFWMEFEDFKRNYDKVEICNLTPDSLTDDTKHRWEVKMLEGNWIRGSTAGGCRNYIDTFWTNPQFKLELQDADDDNACSVVVALMQKNRRKLRKEGLDLETIGFALYEAPDDDDHLGKDFFRYHPSKARSRTYINMREVTERFALPPGKYLLVPTTFQPHHEADFLVRIFSETKADAIEMGSNVDADLPAPPMPSAPEEESDEERGLRRLFEKLAGPDEAISVRELQQMLNGVLSRRKEIQFDGLSLSTCHSIINLMDVDNTGKLEFQEFKVFWEKMKKWIMLFLSFDTDRSGKMSSYELRNALKAAGMQLNNRLLQLIGLRFADDNYDIDFDDYLTCIVRLENMFRAFQAMDKFNRGRVKMNIMQFLMLSMNV